MTTISLKIQIWRYISVSYPAEREVDKLCTLCSFPLFLVFCMCKLKVFIRHLDKTGRRVGHFRVLKILTFKTRLSLRTADAFPVVASLPPQTLFFGGREATTGIIQRSFQKVSLEQLVSTPFFFTFNSCNLPITWLLKSLGMTETSD